MPPGNIANNLISGNNKLVVLLIDGPRLRSVKYSPNFIGQFCGATL